jgi:aspartyl-tRNA(Asn)/glutamyl-tRNA(Gln) amidotransferase subunit A
MNRRKFLNQVGVSTIAATLVHIQNADASIAKNKPDRKKIIKPTADEDIAFLSLHEQAQLIRTKKLSSLELTKIYFQRIKNLETEATSDRKLNCFITLNEENALSKAKEFDALAAKNKWQGPLHGTLISIKDDLEVAGMPMTAGSKLLQNWRPATDAFCITKLKNSGAVISGKTNLEEFTFGALGENLFYGNIKNPFNLKHSSGGSSSGSAASVSAGFCSASIGSDAAGSVRIPSAACGVYGFKPTLGMISRNGLTPFIPTKDAVGCIARSALDIKILFQSMQGYDINDPLTSLVPKNINFLIKKILKSVVYQTIF